MKEIGLELGGVSRQRVWQLLKIGEGLCVECGNDPAFSGELCRDCSRKSNEYHRRHYRSLRANRAVTDGTNRCALCNEKGHNVLSCSKRDEWKDPDAIAANVRAERALGSQREVRRQRRLAGLCPFCGKQPPHPKKRLCNDCTSRVKRYQRAHAQRKRGETIT